ncbi:hypothetical protein O6H91_01G114700 [Diphasiastrum complanatum]|uniref:Uncharacterized protein n=1 Tax=Diphasiastrum complanatum TaxID=34168 RepID=A0ACC2EV09_DIPCM|nr:hypothetical protein O6H91_01G114700 [Diphasiastrum complanatum]
MELLLLASSFRVFRVGINLCLHDVRKISAYRQVKMKFQSTICCAAKKSVWVQTKNKDVMIASVEGGWSTFVFAPDDAQLMKEWASIARIDPLVLKDNQFLNVDSKQIGILRHVSSGNELQDLKSLDGQTEVVVMNALDWQVIPAEGMVAAFQGSKTSVFAIAKTATEAKVFLEDPEEVFALKAYFTSRNERGIALAEATITRIEHVGMGDRVCVDLCCLLAPGEGLLVGSFARGLFLVHSECLESEYVESRPFRVNAGPVHAYVAIPSGRTAYLSELRSGVDVLVVNAYGETRTATVGRVKVESRSLVLIEAEVTSECKSSLLLQNAETVSLVSPPSADLRLCVGGKNRPLAIPVSKLQIGSKVLLSIQAGARHTGLQIQESINEK